MGLDIAGIQAALTEDAIDGWLLFDFKGSNPIARKVAGVKKVKRDGGGETVGLSIEIGKDVDVGRVTEEIVAALAGAGLGVREVAPRLASLEQVFSALTQDEPATGAEVEA